MEPALGKSFFFVFLSRLRSRSESDEESPRFLSKCFSVSISPFPTHRFFSFATVSSGMMSIVYRFKKSSSGSVMSERDADEAVSERE